ncbi:MAG: hypothetical protein ACOC0U_08135 [Desulfovibrionales bacterium]
MDEMTAGRDSPWWLDQGEEVCEHCFQRYAYEMEYRCEYCDGPICPLCIATIEKSSMLLCPECAFETGGE